VIKGSAFGCEAGLSARPFVRKDKEGRTPLLFSVAGRASPASYPAAEPKRKCYVNCSRSRRGESEMIHVARLEGGRVESTPRTCKEQMPEEERLRTGESERLIEVVVNDNHW